MDEDGEAATDADCHLLWCEMGRSCWSCLPVQLPSFTSLTMMREITKHENPAVTARYYGMIHRDGTPRCTQATT